MKQAMLSDTRKAIAMVRRMSTRFQGMSDFLSALDAFGIVLAAESQEPSVSPQSVADAKALVDSHNLAAHRKEGLSFLGVGLALSTDSDRVILRRNGRRVGLGVPPPPRRVFTSGMLEVNDNHISADRKLVALSGVGRCAMMGFSIASVMGLIGILAQWSPKRISEEVSSISAAIQHIALIPQVFDDALNGQVADSWGNDMDLWKDEIVEGCFAHWPPVTQSEAPKLDRAPETDIDRMCDAMKALEAILKDIASFSPELQVDINMVQKELARSKSNRAVRDAAWRQCSEIFAALRADACACEVRTLLQQLLDPEKETVALVSHLMSIAETRAATMGLDLGEVPSIMYFLEKSEAASFGADHCMFWDDMVAGEVAQKMLDHWMQPIMNSIGKFFLSKRPGFGNASLGMPSEKWRSAIRAKRPMEGPKLFSKARQGVEHSGLGEHTNISNHNH